MALIDNLTSFMDNFEAGFDRVTAGISGLVGRGVQTYQSTKARAQVFGNDVQHQFQGQMDIDPVIAPVESSQVSPTQYTQTYSTGGPSLATVAVVAAGAFLLFALMKDK